MVLGLNHSLIAEMFRLEDRTVPVLEIRVRVEAMGDSTIVCAGWAHEVFSYSFFFSGRAWESGDGPRGAPGTSE